MYILSALHMVHTVVTGQVQRHTKNNFTQFSILQLKVKNIFSSLSE